MENDRLLEIERLTEEINGSPNNVLLYMKRGKLLNSCGMRDKALNDFLKVISIDPANAEALEHARMINEIFSYRYTDLYNP